MSHYVSNTLEIYTKNGLLENEPKDKEILRRLHALVNAKLGEFPTADFDESTPYDWLEGDIVEWDTCDEDMDAISKEYPDCLFVLTQRGEYDGKWRNYYKNGDVTYCECREIFVNEPTIHSYF